MILTKAPYRVSFFGGGTDFPEFYREHGGTVLSTAIDRYCYVTLRRLPPFFDYRNECLYQQVERTKTVDEIDHPAIREAMKMMDLSGLRVVYEGDLPARTGLGTSSSFAVALLHAMHLLKGESVTPRDLADEAIYLERTLCGEAGGVQDQIAAAFGGFNRIDMDADGYTVTPLSVETKRLAALQDSLLLVYTGRTHFSANIQSAHKKAIADKARDLLEMKSLAAEAEKVLCSAGDLNDFGRLLHETWTLKRGITKEVSNDSIDALYARVRAAGALGGKLLGAGGGGFLLFFVPQDKQASVRRALGDLPVIPFGLNAPGSACLLAENH